MSCGLILINIIPQQGKTATILIFAFILLFLSLFIILPFLIKIPTFPFYYWLPEVHCEANTSISLFLAGLLGIYSLVVVG